MIHSKRKGLHNALTSFKKQSHKMKRFTDADSQILYKLVEDITGTSQKGHYKKEIIQSSIQMRMSELKIKDFTLYLKKIKTDAEEYKLFVNLITIHTTSWFREKPHYDDLEKRILELYNQNIKKIKLLSLACSTGQEAYSSALILESFRQKKSDFDYEILGVDLDQVSLQFAQRCVYRKDELDSIPQKYRSLVLMGFQKNEGFFTLDSEIRKRVKFAAHNLKDCVNHLDNSSFDFIFLRNVLIYFDVQEAFKIIENCAALLNNHGLLFLGHSEFPTVLPDTLSRYSSSSLKKKIEVKQNKTLKVNKVTISHSQSNLNKRKLLIIDDFSVIRSAIKSALSDSQFIIDEAASAEKASDLLKDKQYDLITLDINMPGESGTEWLRRQRANGLKTPIVIISSTEAKEAELVFGALSEGAQDYISKEILYKNKLEFIATINALIYSDQNRLASKSIQRNSSHVVNINPEMKFGPEVIVIGSSTGGPDALWNLLKNLKGDFAPIVIVQHISHQFSEHFATTLKRVSGLEVRGDVDGEYLKRNHIYVARGDYHLTIKSADRGLYISHDNTAMTNGFRPSVDVLFNSVAQLTEPAQAIILTGMGADGAWGMKQIYKRPYTQTIAQSEESCIVYGMPKEAIEMGGVHFVGDILDIRKQIENLAKLPRLKKKKAS